MILALSLLLISGVYAQDGIDDSSLQNDGNIIEDDFISIQSLIDNADDGDTIDLKGISYLGNGTPINIDKSITINGNDAQLNAQSKSNIFIISKNANVSLLGLTLINGNSKEGGAIYNNGVLSIDGCSFNSNSATYAGAIYNKGSATITDSKFVSNKAANGAAIISKSNLVVSNCEFEKNIISHSYGVISIDYGKATISNSIFNNNKGSDEGCCIFNRNSGNVNITKSKFIGNSAGSYAGAVNNDGTMMIDDCLFDSNSAWGAGAIDNGGTLSVLNSNFTNNAVRKNGGAIDTVGKMEAINCIFDKNTAKAQGGAIIARGDIYISQSSFKDNDADEADAIYINDDVEFSINDNWWNSDNPDFSQLLNINLSDDLSEIKNTSKLYASNVTTLEGSGDKLVISLKDIRDNPINDAGISVILDGIAHNLTTDNNGQANMAIDLTPDTYIAEITYAGSDDFKASCLNVSIIVNEVESNQTDSNQTNSSDTIPEDNNSSDSSGEVPGDNNSSDSSGEVPGDNNSSDSNKADSTNDYPAIQNHAKCNSLKVFNWAFAKKSISKATSKENLSYADLKIDVPDDANIFDLIRFLIDLIKELIDLFLSNIYNLKINI